MLERGLNLVIIVYKYRYLRVSSNHIFTDNLCRVSMTVVCPMSIVAFPFDKQSCNLRFESCKYVCIFH